MPDPFLSGYETGLRMRLLRDRGAGAGISQDDLFALLLQQILDAQRPPAERASRAGGGLFSRMFGGGRSGGGGMVGTPTELAWTPYGAVGGGLGSF